MKPQVIDIAVAMRQVAEKQQREVLAVIKANKPKVKLMLK